MARKLLSEEQRMDCVRMRREGAALKDIAHEYGVSMPSVSKIINRYAPELVRRKTFGSISAYNLQEKCVYPGLAKWMIQNRTTPNELGRMARVGDGMTIYNMLFGKSNLRKGSIDKILQVTGLTYEEAFGVQR